MSLFTPTPRLTMHARERCVEMGIGTEIAKRIVQRPTLTRPGRPGTDCVVAESRDYPDYAVVYKQPPGCDYPLIVTVIFNARDFAERARVTYVKQSARSA